MGINTPPNSIAPEAFWAGCNIDGEMRVEWDPRIPANSHETKLPLASPCSHKPAVEHPYPILLDLTKKGKQMTNLKADETCGSRQYFPAELHEAKLCKHDLT